MGLGITRKLLKLISRKSFKEKHLCLICNHRVGAFLPYRIGLRNLPPLMFALDMIGSDIAHFECPWCGCHDRERHLLMYMRVTGLFESLSNKAVLHFAPERVLSSLIAAQKPLRYIRCDLHPQTPDIENIDISAIPYPVESFDLVIANHVLEHVADDLCALKEIRRVLKPSGHAILQTPYSAKLHHTWFDPGIDTDIARLQAHGQEDHVRLFGKDIFERFISAGLESCVGTHNQLLGEYKPERYGVNEKEPFFLFKRQTNNLHF